MPLRNNECTLMPRWNSPGFGEAILALPLLLLLEDSSVLLNLRNNSFTSGFSRSNPSVPFDDRAEPHCFRGALSSPPLLPRLLAGSRDFSNEPALLGLRLSPEPAPISAWLLPLFAIEPRSFSDAFVVLTTGGACSSSDPDVLSSNPMSVPVDGLRPLGKTGSDAFKLLLSGLTDPLALFFLNSDARRSSEFRALARCAGVSCGSSPPVSVSSLLSGVAIPISSLSCNYSAFSKLLSRLW